MSLMLLHTDLTQFPCDAAVFAADESLCCGGSVFGACMSAAPTTVRDLLKDAGGCAAGQAVLIRDTQLTAGTVYRHLILTAAPVWQNDPQHDTALLAQCYRSSLEKAVGCGCRKIGISLIDSHVFGFPPQLARETAVEAILAYPKLPELEVYLIAFDRQSYGDHASRMIDLERYIERIMRRDAMPAGAAAASNAMQMNAAEQDAQKESGFFGRLGAPQAFRRKAAKQDFAAFAACESAMPLEERLKQLDEGFSQMLLRKIDEAGMKDSECYKKANVSKQLFSKIRSDAHYRPKKETVLAFALALQLGLDETNALLRTAGYSLSHSSKFDIIIEYFISQNIYNVFEINEALYQYDQPVLGSD